MQTDFDILAALDTVATSLAEGADRYAVYRAVQDATNRLIGHRLFTLLVVLPGGEEVQRFYSSNEAAYPVSGVKRVGPTPWGEVVLKGKKSYLGPDLAAIRWAFADHELIASLGLGAVINIPILHHGTLLGTMNILNAEGHFRDLDVKVAARFAPYLVPGFHEEIARLG
ncbi:GAF domain-containing protein [Acuticoccus mangrovi]|uniref:GAF domain-containing protein n=1 Tax=Acuticoccus mangrovi TaxID=2796142 RepID=A0A934MI43_9HYPH|nr:GAF domain-containing protein [Acuticoccus mangrovi]MBJ3778363.1 GAF domain-containing protein [Acuticoccus mangrovi]